MSLLAIRKHYGVPAKRGGRIRYDGEAEGGPLTGTIMSASGCYLRVHFDGERPSLRHTLHPTWCVTYLEA